MRAATTLAAAFLTAGALAVSPAASASATSCTNWTGAQPLSPGVFDNELNGVAVVSQCRAWVVGESHGGNFAPLAERWNGSFWIQTPVPYAGGAPHDNFLEAVAATSASNVWAVGFADDGAQGFDYQTDIQHWNGSSWAQVPSPNPGGKSSTNFLRGVAATSLTNAWAVGDFSNGTAEQTMILRWNGTAWRRVDKIPNPGGTTHDNKLFSVTATSGRNAWAVGDYSDGTVTRTLILHWNGKTWKRIPSPSPRGCIPGDGLTSVSATSATSAWAVGFVTGCFFLSPLTLAEHWNGKAWKIVRSPNPSLSATLSSVAAISATNAWAVGHFLGSGDRNQILIEHWNGRSWKRIPSANPGGASNDNVLDTVAASSGSNVWAAGNYVPSSGGGLALAFHCC